VKTPFSGQSSTPASSSYTLRFCRRNHKGHPRRRTGSNINLLIKHIGWRGCTGRYMISYLEKTETITSSFHEVIFCHSFSCVAALDVGVALRNLIVDRVKVTTDEIVYSHFFDPSFQADWHLLFYSPVVVKDFVVKIHGDQEIQNNTPTRTVQLEQSNLNTSSWKRNWNTNLAQTLAPLQFLPSIQYQHQLHSLYPFQRQHQFQPPPTSAPSLDQPHPESFSPPKVNSNQEDTASKKLLINKVILAWKYLLRYKLVVANYVTSAFLWVGIKAQRDTSIYDRIGRNFLMHHLHVA
jgi:hypothetical protein